MYFEARSLFYFKIKSWFLHKEKLRNLRLLVTQQSPYYVTILLRHALLTLW